MPKPNPSIERTLRDMVDRIEIQDQLLAEARRFVEQFIRSRGEFEAFALAKHADGSVGAVQPSGGGGFQEVLHALMEMANAGTITAVAIASPVVDGKNKLAIIDIESAGQRRVLTVLPYSKKLLGGWKFGPAEQQHQPAKLFARGNVS
jgi:hypothetical protein